MILKIGSPTYSPTNTLQRFFSLLPCQPSLSFVFLMIATLTGGKLNIKLISICSSLKASGGAYFHVVYFWIVS